MAAIIKAKAQKREQQIAHIGHIYQKFLNPKSHLFSACAICIVKLKTNKSAQNTSHMMNCLFELVYLVHFKRY